MKLNQYAGMQEISYRAALRWWRAGQLTGYQAPTETILVEDQTKASAPSVQSVAISALVSSREQQLTLERQAQRSRTRARLLAIRSPRS
jgi:predicted site-specific integrase-resolvase